jgi:hypothetical protein
MALFEGSAPAEIAAHFANDKLAMLISEAKRLAKSLEKSKSVRCSVAIPLQLSHACVLLGHAPLKLRYMAMAFRKVLFLLRSYA